MLADLTEAVVLVGPQAWHVESGEGPSLASIQLCGPREVINTSVNQALLYTGVMIHVLTTLRVSVRIK